MRLSRKGFILLEFVFLLLLVNGDREREVNLQNTENIESAKNRSKIHLTIELDDKDSNKGNFIDLSKGKIQNITIQAVKNNNGKKVQPDEIDKQENEESKIAYDNLHEGMEKEGNKNIDGKDRRRKQLNKKEKFAKENQLSKRKDRKSAAKSKRKEKKHKNNGKKENDLREKKQKKNKQQKELKKKKEKQRRKEKKKQRRLKQKTKRKSKQRKNLKYISNPDGGPNPKNLKIPLTFLRKDIEAGSNQTKHDANMNISETNQEIRTANSTSNLHAVQKLRHLTKQIVVATLKELKAVGRANKEDHVNSTVSSNQGTSSPGITNEATKPKPNVSSPLELRMRKDKRGMSNKTEKLQNNRS